MNIILWENEFEDYTTKEEYQNATIDVINYFANKHLTMSLAHHRARQRLFYYKCLQYYKTTLGFHGFVSLIDTDEYIRLNYKTITSYNNYTATTSNSGGDTHPIISAKPISEPGSVFHFLQDYARNGKGDGDDSSEKNVATSVEQPAWEFLQSSPCIQIPRIRFGVVDSPTELLQQALPTPSSSSTWNASQFQTLRWRYHTKPNDYKHNKISKCIVDLSRISLEDIVPVDSIHLPIRKYCQQRRLHTRISQSFLQIHHYMGSIEQYTYRENDARYGKAGERSIAQYDYINRSSIQGSGAASSGGAEQMSTTLTDDEIRPWFVGFVQDMSSKQDQILRNAALSSSSSSYLSISSFKDGGSSSAERRQNDVVHDLLENVGQLDPKTTWQPLASTDRCALLFFGLPRSFREMVLPSIIQNILIPNARHNCDVYVHYYFVAQELPGRKNRGGVINPRDIFLLDHAARAVYYKYGPGNKDSNRRTPRHLMHEPIVRFVHDTEQDFWDVRGETIKKYHNTIDPVDGKPAYFPWGAKTYTNTSLDNMVKQWHSIEKAFKLMDVTARNYNNELAMKIKNGDPTALSNPNLDTTNITYSRVGMFRSDCMYLTPIDIAVLDKGAIDTKNSHAVIPAFARRPVNDRMVYGPYDAVKIWATQRFQLIEERVSQRVDVGMAMHSEHFLDGTVFPAMRQYYKNHQEHKALLQQNKVARGDMGIEDYSDETATASELDIHWNRDICFVRARADVSVMANDCTIGGKTRNWNTTYSLEIINKIVGHNCTTYKMGFKWIFAGCGEGIKYYSEFY